MSVRRQRYHGPLRNITSQAMRTEIVEPVGGLNNQRSAVNLRPGETPFSQNVVMYDRDITPRSGLSSWGTTPLTGTVLAYLAAPRSDRSEFGYIVSSATAVVFDANVVGGAIWTPLGNSEAAAAAMSSGTADYFSTAVGHRTASSATTGPTTAFITNWKLPPKVWAIGQLQNILGQPIYPISTLTEIFSIDSYFRYVVPIDERMVWFHSGVTTQPTSLVSNAAAYHPTRVSWSARGNMFDYARGGFQDLIDMQGFGTGAVAERDRLVLFSDKQVWQGRPRRDAYAFDFDSIDRGVGLPADFERTVRNTEAGTIWLGEGFQFYRLVGSEVRALGDKVRDYLRSEMRELAHCHAFYNPGEHIYGLLYSDTTGEYPTKALFLRTDTVMPDGERDDGVWFMQDFGTLQFTASGLFGTNTALITSAGSPYRLYSSQTNDNGVAIDVRWRSHAMRAERDLFPMEMLQELWLETDYNSAVTSTLSVFVSANNGATFSAAGSSSVTSGVGFTQIPLSVAAARNTMFELRLNDGTLPRITRMHVKLRGYTGRYTG